MSSIKDAAEEVKKAVGGVRNDVEQTVDTVSEAVGTVRRRPIRRFIAERAEERLAEVPIVGERISGGGVLGRRNRRQRQQ